MAGVLPLPGGTDLLAAGALQDARSWMPPWGSWPPFPGAQPPWPPQGPGDWVQLLSLEEVQRNLDQCRSTAEMLFRTSRVCKEKAERHAEVARKKQLADRHRRMSGGSLASLPEEEKTTLMLRNLPNDYKGELLLQLLNKKGLQGRYDFVYLPMDFKRKSGLGYAFVNMCTHEDACRAMSQLKGFNKWDSVAKGSMKVLSVDWGADQGLEKHLDRYRNSPVMHQDVEESYKPMYFSDGVQKDFPPPTKRVRPPRAKARAKDRE